MNVSHEMDATCVGTEEPENVNILLQQRLSSPPLTPVSDTVVEKESGTCALPINHSLVTVFLMCKSFINASHFTAQFI